MPELPEAQTIADDLDRLIRGRIITATSIKHADVLRGINRSTFLGRVVGQSINAVWRRAKAVVLDLSGGSRMVVVPRFTGALLVRPGGAADDRYDVIAFDLDDRRRLVYRDVRRLGTVSLLDPPEFANFSARLGAEPLDGSLDTNRISESLRSTRQAVKKVLMDQRRIAGVGNIYANEALWLAGIDPSREARCLSPFDVGKLLDAVVTVLRSAIEARGTTFRDFRDALGEPGSYGARLAVYGRPGEPCRRCGTRLVLTHAIDGRATVFCFRCQR